MGDLLSSPDLENILGQHICSKLRPQDIQALAQTCKKIRQLVFEYLPASTWESVATNTLPEAHPLLPLSGTEVCICLERIARFKQVLPEPDSIGKPRQ